MRLDVNAEKTIGGSDGGGPGAKGTTFSGGGGGGSAASGGLEPYRAASSEGVFGAAGLPLFFRRFSASAFNPLYSCGRASLMNSSLASSRLRFLRSTR